MRIARVAPIKWADESGKLKAYGDREIQNFLNGANLKGESKHPPDLKNGQKRFQKK